MHSINCREQAITSLTQRWRFKRNGDVLPSEVPLGRRRFSARGTKTVLIEASTIRLKNWEMSQAIGAREKRKEFEANDMIPIYVKNVL